MPNIINMDEVGVKRSDAFGKGIFFTELDGFGYPDQKWLEYMDAGCQCWGAMLDCWRKGGDVVGMMDKCAARDARYRVELAEKFPQ